MPAASLCTYDAFLRHAPPIFATLGSRTHQCAVFRPPAGHNATRDRAQGGCYFNSVAVAARAVQAKTSARRILVLDWDIHWGRGTQEIFAGDEQILCLSLHREERWGGAGVSLGGLECPGLCWVWVFRSRVPWLAKHEAAGS